MERREQARTPTVPTSPTEDNSTHQETFSIVPSAKAHMLNVDWKLSDSNKVSPCAASAQCVRVYTHACVCMDTGSESTREALSFPLSPAGTFLVPQYSIHHSYGAAKPWPEPNTPVPHIFWFCAKDASTWEIAPIQVSILPHFHKNASSPISRMHKTWLAKHPFF